MPSAAFPEPHAILGAAVVCAETDAEAQHLAASQDLVWVRLARGEFGPFPSPDEALAYPYTPHERAVVDARRRLSVVGHAGRRAGPPRGDGRRPPARASSC